jgi:hypothetical protein
VLNLEIAIFAILGCLPFSAPHLLITIAWRSPPRCRPRPFGPWKDSRTIRPSQRAISEP